MVGAAGGGVSPHDRPVELDVAAEQFADAGVPFLETKLVDREPFKTMYREGETLARLEEREPANQSIRKARENAWVFALEVIKCVKGKEITV